MDISIIIPHYNTPQLLKRLLDGVPISDNIEVIVIDDNSNLQTEIFKSLRESYPHVTFLTNETGKNSPGTCRNIGLKQAKGKWLLFADADDFFVEGFYDIIEKYLSADVDIVFFIPASVDTATGEEATRHIPFAKLVHDYLGKGDRLAELKLRYEHVVPWSKMIRNECVQKNGIAFGNTLIGEDTLFSIKLGSCARKILASKEIIYCVTANKGSLTTRVTKEQANVQINIFADRYHFLKQHLSREDFKLLDPDGLSFVIRAILQKQGLKAVYKRLCFLKKNKVKLIGRRWLKISHWRWKIQEYKSNKKYYHN